MAASPTLLWFRQDLRLADNPALQAALARKAPVVPVYILDEAGEGRWAPGGASRWWLHHSLGQLQAALRSVGSELIFRRGVSQAVLRILIDECGAGAVYWNRRYEPDVMRRDAAIKTALRAQSIDVESFNSALLFEPHTIKNRQGGPFQVFTPYWRFCLSQPVAAPVERTVKTLPSPGAWPRSLPLDELALLPRIRWDAGLERTWKPGEAGALKILTRFVRSVDRYDEDRDTPAREGSSRLSAHLHFGEIGPRQIWAALQGVSRGTGIFPANTGVQKFLSEVGWREFAHHLLYHFPDTPERPLRREFEKFPWREDGDGSTFKRWARGLTGYPIVDAGMRQLWETGWMPNRLRMVAASFLVKHLRLPWQRGAAWFWDTLVDADLANNTLGWQWVAGCGADASPFFRIFAPVLQAQKFDPDGHYTRRWVPELARLPDRYLHAPWEAPPDVLSAAGISLGTTYPRPIVDHKEARDAALAAYQRLKA